MRKVGGVLPAELRENESTVAQAAGQLSSRLLGGMTKAQTDRKRNGIDPRTMIPPKGLVNCLLLS